MANQPVEQRDDPDTAPTIDARSANVRIEHVHLEYAALDGEPLVAIADLSLTIERGEFCAIIGPSGCGKSSLLYLINGIAKPTSGTISVDGRLVTRPSPQRALVFQDAALLPWRSVLANVAVGLEIAGKGKHEREVAATELIKLVGLDGFARKLPNQLSGGMKQRVGIARALCVEPDVLLMDEPFGALDAQTRQLMGVELLRIWLHRKKTVIFVTHDIDEAIFLADRVIVLSSRPSRVIRELRIDLPRPRALDIENGAEFRAYRRQLWDALEEQVAATWAGSA
jgi:NitT/TauT family transport system ATP-binding protein